MSGSHPFSDVSRTNVNLRFFYEDADSDGDPSNCAHTKEWSAANGAMSGSFRSIQLFYLTIVKILTKRFVCVSIYLTVVKKYCKHR